MRSKKAIYNIVSKFAYQFIALISGLLVPRLILEHFGSSYNGTIATITQLLSIVSVLVMGLAGATRTALYKPLAEKDIYSVSKIMATTNSIMRRACLIIAMYAVVLAIVYPLIFESDIPPADCTLLVLILAVGVCANYFFGHTYTFLLQADQSEYISTIITTVMVVLDMLFVVVFIWLGGSILTVRLGYAVVAVLSTVSIYLVAHKRYRFIPGCRPDRSLLGQRKAAMFHSFANIIHNNTDIIILSLFTNAKIVSVYSVYYSIVNNIKQVMSNFSSGLEGAFGNMWTKGETEKFRLHFSTYEFLVLGLTSVVFACTGVLLLPFMQIYTKGITDTNYVLPVLAVLVTVTEGVFCIRQPYITIVQATGGYRATQVSAAIEAAINVISSIVLVWRAGIYGVVIGTLLANLFRTFHYAWYCSKEILQRKYFAFIKKITWHACTGLCGAGLSILCCDLLAVQNWGQWIVNAAICLVIVSGTVFASAWLFYRRETRASLTFVKQLLIRRGR